jgi:hypothetical protein
VTAPALFSAMTLSASTAGTFTGGGTLTPEQVSGILAGQSYCEVDDAVFPSGEIRGQLTNASAAPAPALPGAMSLILVLALIGIGVASQRRAASVSRSIG